MMRIDLGPTARSRRSAVLVFGVSCVVTWLVMGARAFGSLPFVAGDPSRVVAEYVAALDRHDGGGVCRLFAPQLRSFEMVWDAPGDGRRSSCARTVRAHFRDYYSRHRWESARIRGSIWTTVDALTGVAAVHMILVHRYVCARNGVPPEPCRPGRYVLPEIIYLVHRGSHWQIIKPGLVYRASEIDRPLDAESNLYPPGNPTTVVGAVKLRAPMAPCPASEATVVNPTHQLQSTFLPNPRGGPGHALWLRIDALAVARLSPDTICFTLSLGAPPHPDSAYQISVGTIRQQAAADLFDVEFDGLGNPHPLLSGIGALSTPSLRAYLPRVFLAGDQLEIIGSDRMFSKLQRFLVVASSHSIQADEPLLRRPLDAGDLAPQAGCLTFPTGNQNTSGLCGSIAGP